MNLLAYEWKKITTNRKYLNFLVLGILLICVSYGYNYFMGRQETKQSEDLMKSALYLSEKEQGVMIDPEASANLQESEKNLMIANNQYYQSFLDRDQQLLYQFEKQQLKGYVEFHSFNQYLNAPPPPIIADYLINKPKVNDALLKKGYQEESIRYGVTGVQFLTSSLRLLTSFVGLGFLLLAFGDLFPMNLEQRKSQLLLTQPVSRQQLLLSNLTVSFGSSTLFLLGLAILALVIGSLFGSFGHLDYPLLQGFVNPDYTTIIPNWLYIGQVFLLFILGLLFVLIFQAGIAMFVKNSYLSLAITLVLSFVFNRLNNTPVFTKLTQWLPFTYLDPSRLFIGGDFKTIWLESQIANRNGSTAQSIFLVENEAYFSGFNTMRYLGNPNLTFKTALIVLVVSNIIGFILINQLFKRVATIK